MRSTVGILRLLAGEDVNCGSGKASAAASAVLRQACESTLALSSRQGIIATVLLCAWAAIHYLVGAIGLSQEMRGAALRTD
jgi:hypothetical protein